MVRIRLNVQPIKLFRICVIGCFIMIFLNKQPLNRQGSQNHSFDHQRMNRELDGRQIGNISRGSHKPMGSKKRGR